MFRFDDFMEEWARSYKPYSQGIDERRGSFFRATDEFLLEEFLGTFQSARGKPMCGIVTNLTGKFDTPKRIFKHTYKFLFFQYANPRDFREQATVKYECMRHAIAFAVYMEQKKREHQRTDRLHPLATLDLGDLDFDMLGPLLDGWFLQIVTLDCPERIPVCYSEADYVEKKN